MSIGERTKTEKEEITLVRFLWRLARIFKKKGFKINNLDIIRSQFTKKQLATLPNFKDFGFYCGIWGAIKNDE